MNSYIISAAAMVLLAFIFFSSVFLGSRYIYQKQKYSQTLLLPISSSFYVWLQLMTLLSIYGFIEPSDAFTLQSLAIFLCQVAVYMVLFQFAGVKDDKEMSLKNLVLCVFFVTLTISIDVYFVRKINPSLVVSTEHILIAGLFFIISLFLCFRFVQQIYIDKVFNKKKVPFWFLSFGALLTAYTFVGSTIEIIRSLNSSGGNSLFFTEVLSILLLLGVTTVYGEKQYNRKEQELVESNKHLNHLAYHDTLTGLPNRRKVMQSIEEWMAEDIQFAVVFIDLDHFKHVNDLLGHNIGDELLKVIASRLEENSGSDDIVGRLGGDEFIILKPVKENLQLDHFSTELIVKVVEPVRILEHEIVITTSIGIALFPTHGKDVNDIMKKADIAMYNSKDKGRNTYFIFTLELDESIIRKMTLKEDLKHALVRNELEVHFQPKIRVSDQSVNGFEALLRWKHPSIGFIPPAEFIPIAEESGAISEIGSWVLRQACREISDINKKYGRQYIISVNFSIKQLLQKDIVETVSGILSETGLDPKFLELEITERVAMNDAYSAGDAFMQLLDLGLMLSVDDFGTGYNSLSNLQELQIQRLKIDKTFIQQMESDEHNKALVASIVSMGKHLGMQITAEGVETPEQLSFLMEIGCDEAQGFYFSKPKPIEQIMNTINAGSKVIAGKEQQ
ncbi:putative bifunctional diguanylate cyclase/phosphodiesterase [Bacillus infantis]|uniref:putative bifunctional diguanylate cyclase/phosphodiesterase n=1 Tax=Bacillus infantis TaxID=324767 RepID=UPI003CF5EF69